MTTRQFSRVRFHVEATVTAAGRTFAGAVENLSMNGMFVVTPERLPEGATADIAISLTGTDPAITVSFCGKVSRTTEHGIGLLFEKIDLESYTHLRNIISYNSDDAETIADEIHSSIDRKLAAAAEPR